MTDEPVRLKTSHRDIRVTAGSSPLARGALGVSISAAQDFAQQVAGRYTTRRRWLPGVERILRRLGIGVVQRVSYHQHQIGFYPRIQLALTVTRSEPAQVQGQHAAAPPAHDISRTMHERLLTARTLTLARHVTQRVQTLERRLVTRTTRTEHPAASGAQAGGNGTGRQAAARVAPVPRVLVQSNPAPSAASPPPAGHSVTVSEWPAGPATAAPPDVTSPPALDQITEQVLQRIEQRLVAHRERMGRA